jgi:hypothetical protein
LNGYTHRRALTILLMDMTFQDECHLYCPALSGTMILP